MKSFLVRRVLLLSLSIAVCSPFAAAQEIAELTAGDPGANVNIVGPTPDPADIRDDGLKQQNEPSCAIRPGDADCIICAFNDYRTVDVPLIEDAWQGVAMSCDAGTTWTSRVAPGHPLHAAPIGTEFAADPRMIGIHGAAIFNFIGGNRDQDSGVLAIQHWLEVNKEDADFYEPGKFTYIVDEGTSGRFIDKPDAAFLPELANQQGTITLSTVMENEALGTITRDFPTGDLFVAYAVFTGSQSVKVLVKRSGNLGVDWQNKVVKLSEDQNLVSGISLTAMGNSVLAVWRRAGDNNDPDSIMYAYTTNRGNKWTKGAVLADICSFDQISATTPSAVTFRTNDFPWAANDGKNFYVFYSDRNFDGASNCTGGRPRIVMKHAGELSDLDSSDVDVIDDAAPAGSFQFMPAATGANGKVQVAWYDTRRENLPGGPAVVADYFDNGTQINRKVDVYTARVVSDENGDNVDISDPVRVSQFRIGARIEGPPGNQTAGSIAIEGEASFSNAKLYASGFLSFIGDYIAVGAEQFRYDDNGKVISNASPIVSPLVDKTDFFVAWTSNRDVRGNIFDETSLENTVPYAPPENAPGSGSNTIPTELLNPLERPEKPMHADASGPPAELNGVTRTTEGIEDPFVPLPDVCAPLDPQDRTRNANIYGSRVRDQLRLKAPTPTKPLTNLQRSFPVALSNVNDSAQTYLLRVTNQPADFPSLGRASFRQLPAVPPFDQNVPPPVIWEELTVPPQSTFARTLFLVSNVPGATTGVQVFAPGCADDDPLGNYGPYQGSCSAITSITLGGEGPSGPLQQPDYESPVCDPADPVCTSDVLQAELHNPELINPELINPELINPELINPELINPELINPELINPELINPELINLGFLNPELINPELINPELINPELINPELINPELINPELINSSFDNDGTITLDADLTWTDYTFIVRNTGNVTTSFNADITLSGSAADDVDSQLVAWTLYITPTSRDCDYRPQVERRVLATVNNPDDEMATEELEIATIDEPFNGEISAIAAPGQALFFTRRVFGTPEELANIAVSGFTSASQAANCSQTDRPAGNTDPYFCQLSLADERERILLDTQPPEFGGLMDGDVIPIPAIEADRPGGACVDLVASGIVSASDNGQPVDDVSCTDSLGAMICTSMEPGQSIPVITLTNPTPAPISCSATDDAGNTATIDLFVDVRDTEEPVFTSFPTSPISIDAGATTGMATLNFENGLTAADVDGVDPSPVISCVADTGQISGEPLPIGNTTIDCTASDASGNFAEQSYVVQVNDVTPPEFIDIPLPDVSVLATGTNGATVNYAIPNASDTGGGTPTVSCDPPPGVFQIGDTTVTCTADDGRGNTASASFVITVTDTIPPVVTVPSGGISVSQDSPAGTVVNYAPQVTATDNIDPNPNLVCTPASGSVFPAGATTVNCTATDTVGNIGSASFEVTVTDTGVPLVSVPVGGISVSQDSATGSIVNFAAQVTATDSIDPSPAIGCSPPSGSLFPAGTTTVICTATDATGNSSSANFVVTVTDTGDPVLTVPSGGISVPQEDASGATIDFSTQVTAVDDVDPSPDIDCSPPSGSLFALGTTTVNCTATDDAGNSAAASFVVTVTDAIAPVISAPGDIVALPQNIAGANVSYLVTVSDNDDPNPTLNCTPDSGGLFALGPTTVSCTATDIVGNSSNASFLITVAYGGFGITPKKLTSKAGSSNPLTWGWTDENGVTLDTSGYVQMLEIRECGGPVVLQMAADPGSSDFRVKVDDSWEYNWQSDDGFGVPLPKGEYCARVTAAPFLQPLESPPIRLR